jgi:hypothetical protein
MTQIHRDVNVGIVSPSIRRAVTDGLWVSLIILWAGAGARAAEPRSDQAGEVSIRLMSVPRTSLAGLGVKRLALGQFCVHSCADALLVERGGAMQTSRRPAETLSASVAGRVKAAAAAELSQVRNMTLVNLSDFDKVAAGDVAGLKADFVRGIQADAVLYGDIWVDLQRVEAVNKVARKLATYDRLNDLPIGWRTELVHYPFFESSATMVVKFTLYRLRPTPRPLGVRTVMVAGSDISAAYSAARHRQFNVLRGTKIAVAVGAKAAVAGVLASDIDSNKKKWIIAGIEAGRIASIRGINVAMYRSRTLIEDEDRRELADWRRVLGTRFATDGIRDQGCKVALCDTAVTPDMLMRRLAEDAASRFAREVAPSFTVHSFPVLDGSAAGTELLLNGAFRRADDYYKRKAGLGTRDRYNYAITLVGLGYYDEAMKELDKVIEADPGEDLWYHIQARLAETRGLGR